MDDPALILCVVCLVAMVAASVWAAVKLPSDTKFGARFGGTSGFDYRAGKTGSLLTWPLLGLFVTGGSLAISNDQGSDANLIPALGAFTMLILLAGQVGAIRRAR